MRVVGSYCLMTANTSPLTSHEERASCCMGAKLLTPVASHALLFPAHSAYGDAGASYHKKATKGFRAMSGSPKEDIDAHNRTLRQRARMLYMAAPVEPDADDIGAICADGRGGDGRRHVKHPGALPVFHRLPPGSFRSFSPGGGHFTGRR